MIRLILNGCNGRMGQTIARLAKEEPSVEIVCGFDPFSGISNPFPVYADFSAWEGVADVLIDFSNSAGVDALLDFCVSHGLPCVIATTGLSNQQKEHLTDCARKIPVFFSANMSIGVNLLMDLACRAAKLLEGSFDIEIVEKHHNQKLDAPSGTALAIADAISGVLSEPTEYVYDRHSVRKKRSPNEIGLHAVRGGTIVGEHDVIFAGNQEVIQLSHSSASREVFAVGALRAARFLAGKPAGLYSMKELVESV